MLKPEMGLDESACDGADELMEREMGDEELDCPPKVGAPGAEGTPAAMKISMLTEDLLLVKL